MRKSKKIMKGGMCPPCLMAGGVASGKLMLGAAAGITGLSSVAALKSKKNSFNRGGSRIKKRKRTKKIKKRISRRKITKSYRRKSNRKSKRTKRK